MFFSTKREIPRISFLFYDLRNVIGEIPVCFLKNFPKVDWSGKKSLSATCCTFTRGLFSIPFASIINASCIHWLADRPLCSLRIDDKYCVVIQSLPA